MMAYKSACIFAVALCKVDLDLFFVGHFTSLGRTDFRFLKKYTKWHIVAKIMVLHDLEFFLDFASLAENTNFIFELLNPSKLFNLIKI